MAKKKLVKWQCQSWTKTKTHQDLGWYDQVSIFLIHEIATICLWKRQWKSSKNYSGKVVKLQVITAILTVIDYLQPITAIKCQLLPKLQLLPAIECSEKSYAVDHYNPKQSAVIQLHFHCTFTAKVCSVILNAQP